MSTSKSCLICSAPSKYVYFGVLLCQSCKRFFKQNAHRTFTCSFDNQCEINVNIQQTCSSCRLKKCFQYGMTQEKCKQLNKFPIVNDSLLSSNHWILLSNLINCFKENQISSNIDHLTIEQSHHQNTFFNYEKLVDEFFVSVSETVEIYLEINKDLQELFFDHRSLLLRNIAENISCIDGVFIMESFHLYDLQYFVTAMNDKYGQSTMDIHQRARKFIDRDLILSKLAISLYAFSSNTFCYLSNESSDLTDPINIYKIQNKYAELTWKYLLYQYDYPQAVKRFLNIILWLCSINILTFQTQTLDDHLQNIQSIVEQTELAFVLDDFNHSIESISSKNIF